MPAYVHPLRTFGDLVAFDLKAVVSCRCGRHGTIDAGSDFFRDRTIGASAFRCTTILPLWSHGGQCPERHNPEIRKRGRADWNLPDHWRAMMRRQSEMPRPGRLRTFRDYVQAGEIAWLSDAGCPAGYRICMVAFDEPPWDRLFDKPIGAIICPACRRAMKLTHANGGHGSGGQMTGRLDEAPATTHRPPERGEHVVITGAF